MSVNNYTKDGQDYVLIDALQQEISDFLQVLSINAAPQIQNLKIGSVKIKNFYANGLRKNSPKSPKPYSADIPNVLNSTKANALWTIAKANKWVDQNLQPLISKSMQALLAHEMAVKLEIKAIWKPFEIFWNEPNLRQYYQKGINMTSGGDFLLRVTTAFQAV